MYVNYASTLLKNWLLKNGCTLKREAGTNSIYFKYEDITIRLGDHLPCNLDSNYIYIMISQSHKQFGIFVNRSYLTFNSISELKVFLKNLFTILTAQFKSQLSVNSTKLRELENKLKNNTEISDLKKIHDDELKKLREKIGNQSMTLNQTSKQISKYKSEIETLKEKLKKYENA